MKTIPKPSRNQKNTVATFAKVFSIILAIGMLLLGFCALTHTVASTVQLGSHGSILALAPDAARTFHVNLFESNWFKNPMPENIANITNTDGYVTAEILPAFTGSGMNLRVTTINSLFEWKKHQIFLSFHSNQSYYALNFTAHDPAGNIIHSSRFDNVGTGSGFTIGVSGEISSLGDYLLAVTNLGTDLFDSNVEILVYETLYQRPLFYSGLTGIIIATVCLSILCVTWLWTRRRSMLT